MTETLQKGILYLIPSPIAQGTFDQSITEQSKQICKGLQYFIVENAKSARVFLKQIGTTTILQELKLEELNEHTRDSAIEGLLLPLTQGQSGALISEAGVPCIADPGSKLVATAHSLGISVVPLVGPSAVLLAIMSSGLNGQNFSFCGYLPATPYERELRIKELEQQSKQTQQSYFFIETPYRASKLFDSMLKICRADTKISVAINLESPDSRCFMKTSGEWKKVSIELDDKLVVFGLESSLK